ncbi:Zn-ribbon domain-containing OB-fold protein [Streptomyces sp. NPDC020801]|uniref:Zn-ribbon domain-containing OB-fold protein n=1 Tax=unclassified Streptomyces TaxID=2593676 RepID=UPI0037B6AAAB
MSARFDLPEADPFTRAYWDAAAGGRLLVRRCGACGQAHHYPREFCPHCWSEDVTWEAASGRASLYTWSVVHRNDLPPFADRTPYVAAVVELEEGPRMMTEVVGCAPGGLWVGMALKVAFRMAGSGSGSRSGGGRADGQVAVPLFRPQ